MEGCRDRTELMVCAGDDDLCDDDDDDDENENDDEIVVAVEADEDRRSDVRRRLGEKRERDIRDGGGCMLLGGVVLFQMCIGDEVVGGC